MHTRKLKVLVVAGFVGAAAFLIPAAAWPLTSAPNPEPEMVAGSRVVPGATSTTSGPIVVTTDDRTIDGVTITSSGSTGIAIEAVGSASNPIRNLTIRNCTIKGFNTAIEVRYVVNLVVDNCLIEDAGYGGIMVYSGIGGRITNNTIQRIGYGIDTNGPNGNNAYGIALSRVGSEDLKAEPRSSDFVVDGNLIEDVPLWHGIDTHAGSRITFSNNLIRRCARPFFITGDGAGYRPEAIDILDNRLEEATQVQGGTDRTAITLVRLEGGRIVDNSISSTYPTPHVYDYLVDGESSVNISISGETVIP